MRFSDMMGAEDQRSPQPSPATPDAEAEIADALAPYLESSAASTPVEVVEVVEAGEPVDAVDTQPAEPLAAPVDVVDPREPVEAAPVSRDEPIAARVADFTPLSDDLLPHRR